MTDERSDMIGKAAGDFSLRDQNEKKHKLSDYKGKKVLLSFHPLAWTGVCATQMQNLEENKAVLDGLNAVALGMSIDHVPCKKAWAEKLQIKNTALLADFWPHGVVAKQFGVFDEEHGFSKRVNIVLDEEGKVAFFKVYPLTQLPDIKEVIEFIKNMK